MGKKSTAELDIKDLELTDLELIENDKAGARARAKRIARNGLPALAANSELSKHRQDISQYRECIALLWNKERILLETGWNLQKFLAVERRVRDEDRQLADEADPRVIFQQYKERQLLAAKELEDLAEIFRHSRQFSSLVSAIKVRSEILNKIISTGQEMGVIKRAAREINVNEKIDFRAMSVSQLQIHLTTETNQIKEMFVDEPKIGGPAAVVLKNILQSKKEVIEVVKEKRKPKVKRLLIEKPKE